MSINLQFMHVLVAKVLQPVFPVARSEAFQTIMSARVVFKWLW